MSASQPPSYSVGGGGGGAALAASTQEMFSSSLFSTSSTLLFFLSEFCSLLALLALISHLRRTKSLEGLSLQTLFAVIGTRTLHFAATVLGFVSDPNRYFVCDLAAVLLAWVLLLQVLEFAPTYEGLRKDGFGRWMGSTFSQGEGEPGALSLSVRDVPQLLFLYAFSLSVAVFTCLLRRGGGGKLIGSFLFCFYEAVTLFSLFPQLFIWQRGSGRW
eukprot:g9209.t1